MKQVKSTFLLVYKMCLNDNHLKLNPSRPDPGWREKINLNFYFRGLKGLHKTFWGTTKKCENKNLIQFFYFNINFLNAKDGKGKENF